MALFVFVWFVGNLSNPMKTSTIIMGQSITINVKQTRNVRITVLGGLGGAPTYFLYIFVHTFFCASIQLVHFSAVHYIFLRRIKSPLTISSNYQLKRPPIKTVHSPTNFCMRFRNCPPQALPKQVEKGTATVHIPHYGIQGFCRMVTLWTGR